MSAAISQANNEERRGRLLANLKRGQLTVLVVYIYDTLVLFGFYLAGFVDIIVPVVVCGLLALSLAVVNLAHAKRWSLDLADPSMFLPQQLYAIFVALGVAAAAPQIGFQPFATLFAISAFSFMAPNPKTLIVGWTVAAIGAVSVIFEVGPRLAMPTSTFAGQALTGAVVIGLLARCIWIAMSFRKLQRRLSDKNKALQSAMERIEALANRDDLTGLPNRRSITAWLEEQMAISNRTGAPLSVAFLDLDHFKRINDTYGHLAGDRALQLFAKLALDTIRATDRLGRHGGEEFLVVLLGTPLSDASEPLERIRRRVASFDWSAIDAGLRLTITIGATQYQRGESVERLMRRADLALYLGKEAGRDRVVLGATPVDAKRVERLTAKSDAALQNLRQSPDAKSASAA